MITKQAYLNLAAVDEDFAAELEKTALSIPGLNKGINWLKNKFARRSAPPPNPQPSPPNMGPQIDPSRRAIRGIGGALRDKGRELLNAADQGVRRGVGHAGTFLTNSVTGGQARTGWGQIQKGLGGAGGRGFDQALINQGAANLAAGAAKTGLLYGGTGYGAYRMLRGDSSEPEVARMYHAAMPY